MFGNEWDSHRPWNDSKQRPHRSNRVYSNHISSNSSWKQRHYITRGTAHYDDHRAEGIQQLHHNHRQPASRYHHLRSSSIYSRHTSAEGLQRKWRYGNSKFVGGIFGNSKRKILQVVIGVVLVAAVLFAVVGALMSNFMTGEINFVINKC